MNKNTESISDSQLQDLGTPTAHFGFGSDCSANHFHDHSIILNIAVCGGWPDSTWGGSGCPSGSCPSYVDEHSSGAFDNAYFDINYLKVFKYSGSGPSPAPSPECGYVPSDCTGDLNWALNSGRSSNPEYYPDFQSVTGSSLASANYKDMVLYFHCKNVRPGGRCNGIQAPCDRSCAEPCDDTVSSACQADLDWAANTGTQGHPEWYPAFQSVTGVPLSAATAKDVQLYWVCKGEDPNGNCDGMQMPRGRSCVSSAYTPLSPLMDPVDGGYGITDHFVLNPYDVIFVLCLVLVVLCAINLCVTIGQRQRASYVMKM